MISLSPPSLFQLFKNNCLRFKSSNRNFSFFLSFEDALWNILDTVTIKDKTALIPSFFCPDVSTRIREKGFEVLIYDLDSELNIELESITNIIKDKNIGIFISYLPMGMMSKSLSALKLREVLGSQTIIIEDLADCLVEESFLKIIDDRHYIIDSIRKILPIQGSRVWSTHKLKSSCIIGLIYKFKAIILWNLFRFISTINSFFNFNCLDNFRWSIFGIHSDLIGSNNQGVRGSIFDLLILSFIDIDKFKKCRANILRKYILEFNKYSWSCDYRLIEIISEDYSEVRFPIFRGPKGILQDLVDTLDKIGISCDIHFEESRLGEKYDFMLLPLDLSLTDSLINKVVETCYTFSCKK